MSQPVYRSSPLQYNQALRCPDKACKRFNISPGITSDQLLDQMLDRLHQPLRQRSRLRPRSQGNAIVPFHLRSNLWNGQIDCSQGNGTIAYQFCFLFRRERNRSVDMFLFACSYGKGMELFVSLFSCSIFWNRTVLCEAFPSERSPLTFRFSE